MTEPPEGWSSPSSPTPPPASAPPPGYGPAYSPPASPWYAAPPPPGVVPLRPLALGELLDGSIKVIRRYPKPTLGLAAVVALITTLLNVVVLLLLDNDSSFTFDSTSDSEAVFDSIAADLSAGLFSGAIGYLGGLVLTGALIVVVGRAVQGKPAPSNEVWAAIRPRLLPLLGLSLLTGLLTAGLIAAAVGITIALAVASEAAALVGIPLVLGALAAAVYLFVRLSLAPAALVLEKAGVVESMRRSSVLVKGSWWRILGISLLTRLLAGILSMVLALPLGLVAAALLFASGETAALVATQIAGGIASVITAPFVAGVTALLYVDRRMRAEGLDVALQTATQNGPSL